MAIVQFKYGNGALPSVKNSGALYLNQYNKKVYVDLDESNRVCIGDFQKVNWASSSTVTSPGNALKALTVKDNNILYLTYDLTTGHSALWYYDDSNSQNAQFREIISSESISIIASEFDRIDEELTDLNSELENLAGKVSKEELEGYNFATEEEAAAFAIAAISNVQGNATDTAEILTIQGTRKYVDSKVQEVSSNIETLETKVNGIGGKVSTLEGTVNEHTSQISSVSQTASGAANKAAEALTSAQEAAEAAAEAERLATAVGSAAQAATNLAKEKVTLDEVRSEGYITAAQSNTAIANASSTLIGSSTDTSNENTIYGAKKYADSLNSLVNSKVDTIASNVNTKVSKEELEGYNFVTEEEAAAFAIAAISNVQGSAASDTSTTLTIQGTRKYADTLNTALDSRITTNTTKLSTLESNLSTLSTKVNGVDTKAGEAKVAADKANTDLAKIKITAESAAATASDAASLAATANTKAESKTTLQAVQNYIANGGYTTTSAVNTAIENAVKSTKEYSDAGDQKITSRIDTLENNIGNLSNIMNFVGILTIDLSHGATNNLITIDGKSYTAVKGDVVVDSAGEEFVFDGSKWQQVGNITSEATAISNLQGRMTTGEGNITDLQGRMTTGEGNITDLQGRMTTAESNLRTVNDTIGTKLTPNTDTLWGVLTWGTW